MGVLAWRGVSGRPASVSALCSFPATGACGLLPLPSLLATGTLSSVVWNRPQVSGLRGLVAFLATSVEEPVGSGFALTPGCRIPAAAGALFPPQSLEWQDNREKDSLAIFEAPPPGSH